MKTKAVFFDIDGTLVSFHTHRIPKSTLEAVSRLRAEGVKVFIATGRPMPFINNLDGLEYDGIIESNGAHCQLADGTVIFHKPIPQTDIRNFVDYCRNHELPAVFASHDDIFITRTDKRTDDVFRLLDIEVPTLRPAESAFEMDVLQIVGFFVKEEEPFLMRSVLPKSNAQRWHPDFADVIVGGVDKSTGIDAVAAYFGWDVKQTMAFGDGGNDIGMLRHVGCGIAMGNASEEVKQHARYVTDDIDRDGVAKAIERYLE
jgi:Cof subfamily protein (haloacid dehalogenase superfamily)